jgi:hypothetical protein
MTTDNMHRAVRRLLVGSIYIRGKVNDLSKIGKSLAFQYSDTKNYTEIFAYFLSDDSLSCQIALQNGRWQLYNITF